jgi:hypothetical protein
MSDGANVAASNAAPDDPQALGCRCLEKGHKKRGWIDEREGAAAATIWERTSNTSDGTRFRREGEKSNSSSDEAF